VREGLPAKSPLIISATEDFEKCAGQTGIVYLSCNNTLSMRYKYGMPSFLIGLHIGLLLWNRHLNFVLGDSLILKSQLLAPSQLFSTADSEVSSDFRIVRDGNLQVTGTRSRRHGLFRSPYATPLGRCTNTSRADLIS
jgi:hypothetical protein